jgi:hypothetical protein
MVNILPINDIDSHVEDSTCKCSPKVIFENGEMIIVHNSFDGREYKEQLIDEVERQFLFDDMIGSDDL